MTVYRLEPRVQHYAWGDTGFIPSLLGEEASDVPFAELWMGTHPSLPCRVYCEGEWRPLAELLPEGRDLPYLLKVLSAAKPLSIQAHPTKAQAEAGYAREQAAGIPLDAPHRSYTDARPKPELLCALTEFYALRGFRPEEELAELSFVRDIGAGSLAELYERLMTMPQEDVDRLAAPLVAGARAAGSPREREYWASVCEREFSRGGHVDRGVFSIYLLNLIRLEPGEAIYLDAGVLHAYLRGSGIEIMANSNNVLRGGMTAKHVDVPELLRTIRFEGARPQVLRASPLSEDEWAYVTPAEEFELRRVVLPAGGRRESGADHEAELLLLVEGRASIGGLSLERGEVAFVPALEGYSLSSKPGATIFKATVPR